MQKGKREMMKAKLKREMKKVKGKLSERKLALTIFAITILIIMLTSFVKGNAPKIIGYTYASGNTVWEMAEKHCPKGMDVRYFAGEIERVNELKNSVVYEHYVYKIPVYESESEYLDMTTVVGYESSDDGVLLLTDDGNGYFIEK